jgi:hypothetical protein
VSAQSDGTSELLTFDAQLRYLDCPTQIFNGYEEATVNRGWQLINQQELWVVPGNLQMRTRTETPYGQQRRFTLRDHERMRKL